MGQITNTRPHTFQEHPGGAKIILKYAGRDATAAYEPIHPPDALDKNLPPQKHLGEITRAGATVLKQEVESRRKTQDEIRVEEAKARKPPVSRIMSVLEMEVSFLSCWAELAYRFISALACRSASAPTQSLVVL